MSEAIQLVPTKPDAEIAEELKQKLIQAAEPALKVLEEIKKAGFDANIQFGMNAIGKMQINHLMLIKQF